MNHSNFPQLRLLTVLLAVILLPFVTHSCVSCRQSSGPESKEIIKKKGYTFTRSDSQLYGMYFPVSGGPGFSLRRMPATDPSRIFTNAMINEGILLQWYEVTAGASFDATSFLETTDFNPLTRVPNVQYGSYMNNNWGRAEHLEGQTEVTVLGEETIDDVPVRMYASVSDYKMGKGGQANRNWTGKTAKRGFVHALVPLRDDKILVFFVPSLSDRINIDYVSEDHSASLRDDRVERNKAVMTEFLRAYLKVL